MPIARRQFIATLGAATAAIAAPVPLRAQTAQTLQLYVGYPPGGAVDVVARAVGEAMATSGYQVLVQNKTGASGRLATDLAMLAPADGSVILCMPGGNATIFPHVYKNLRNDPLNDLVPLGTACEFSFGLAAGPATPATTLKEFIDWAKANPGKASYGTPGGGTAMHFLGVMLGREAGIDFQHVPYRGGAAAIVDVIGGTVPTLFTTLPNIVNPHLQGKVRILAFSGREPIARLPGVPTFAQAGYPDLTLTEIFAFFARRGTPPDTAARLSTAISKAVQAPQVVAALEKLEFAPLAMEPAALTARLRAETERWRKVVAESGYTATD
jgi:tripartite-type tricarboxylate transporter receptor subunit TctC